MYLQSKRTGNITFKDGNSVKTLVAGAVLKVESEKVANTLMKMYPNVIVEVAKDNDDTTDKAPKGGKGNKTKKEGGGNDDTTDNK